MCEAPSLVRGAREAFNEGSEVLDHHVIIRGIVSGDTEYLGKANVCITSITIASPVPYR